MRRGTLITIIVLFVVLLVVAVRQISIASRDQAPYPGPSVANQLPAPSAGSSPASG